MLVASAGEAEALSGMCAVTLAPLDLGRSAAVAQWAALPAAIKNSHKCSMSKTRVEFKYKHIAEDKWQIEAHYPGAELRHIKGFKSKAEVDEWLQGSRRIDWLRSQGYAK
jgi:hypothetical protein